jgi:phosphoribosylamine--glycine ligase
MGSYRDVIDYLPFMSENDRREEETIAKNLFKHLKKTGKGHELRGLALYLAFMHGKGGSKMLEINSRGGDPEFMNIMTSMEDDFVDVCFDMIDGTLKGVKMKNLATVVTYKVPPAYGGYDTAFPKNVNSKDVGSAVDLSKAYRLEKEYKNNLRIYPGSLKVESDGKYYAAGSRTIASVGIADTIEEARGISLQGIASISGGELWHRGDIASKEHIRKSIDHMKAVKSKA